MAAFAVKPALRACCVAALVSLPTWCCLGSQPAAGTASWYGEQHRGRLMANGKPFNPDKLTAASWFYPLGTKLRVTSTSKPTRSVIVTVTDRGPAHDLVRQGRIIDLTQAAFADLSSCDEGLIKVSVQPLRSSAASKPVRTASR